MAKIHLIIPAAGKGTRMGNSVPKQFSVIGNKTIIEWIEFIFSNVSSIHSISIAVNPNNLYIENINPHFSSKTTIYKSGGDTRSKTVLNTLNQMKSSVDINDWIMVHDAARLGINESMINKFILEIANHKVGGIMAIPVIDTVKRVNKAGIIVGTENRNEIWLAQTPQMFRYKVLKRAIEQFKGDPTDECEAVEFMGLKPKIFEGSAVNFKVTYPEDMEHIKAIFNPDSEGVRND
jgi:2-C-methyl-D-erythritol 4-phosphate cytidylyltransferase